MKHIATLNRTFTVEPGKPETGHQFEFQEVCADLEKDFGKLVWTLP